MQSVLREAVMQVARREIGVMEEPRGSNWGRRIRDYLASVGLYSPAPWCAAFVYFVFREALGQENMLPKTGYTPDILNWARRERRIVSPDAVKPADLVLIYFPSLGRVGHVGVVGWIGRIGWWRVMFTIEGNTNDDGGREGYKVTRRYRRVTENHYFVRTL